MKDYAYHAMRARQCGQLARAAWIEAHNSGNRFARNQAERRRGVASMASVGHLLIMRECLEREATPVLLRLQAE